MPKNQPQPNPSGSARNASAVLYAVDLEDTRHWVGIGDEARFRELWNALREEEDEEEDEEARWEPAELEVLERLLRRMVFEGALYEGVTAAERYYLTQLLIDLFDEYLDPDPLSEDLPLDRLLKAVEELPRGSEAARLCLWLLRGRELRGERQIWENGPVEESLAYIGYVTREEAPKLVAALDDAMGKMRTRPSGLLKQIRSAAEECARAELDLVSFVG